MKNKNKLKYLTLGILLTGAVGFSTLAVKQVQVKAESENVVNINRENKKLVSYNDASYQITLSANELTNYHWENLNNYLVDEYENIGNTVETIINEMYYGQDTLVYSDSDYVEDNDLAYFAYSNLDDVILEFNNGYDDNSYEYKFNIVDGVIENDITFDITSSKYADLKSAIELDIQANESNYGESIITAISSGLGLIPDLAGEFLTGFTTLFWDSVNEKLTDFGTFALVFLGVAITMAVVKLCLAILRSNTGA